MVKLNVFTFFLDFTFHSIILPLCLPRLAWYSWVFARKVGSEKQITNFPDSSPATYQKTTIPAISPTAKCLLGLQGLFTHIHPCDSSPTVDDLCPQKHLRRYHIIDTVTRAECGNVNTLPRNSAPKVSKDSTPEGPNQHRGFKKKKKASRWPRNLNEIPWQTDHVDLVSQYRVQSIVQSCLSPKLCLFTPTRYRKDSSKEEEFLWSCPSTHV